LAAAFQKAGYEHILDEEGLIRPGKAEGMMLGTMLAKLSGRRFIGFIDSDNYFPGSVLEYCRLFAAGFAMARQKNYAMVRVSWSSKPKIVENSLYFAKWGRSSAVTNRFLNELVSFYTGFESEAIRTGNAGEQAMTLELAMRVGYSSGYSVEPYQLVYLMEQFGGIEAPNVPQASDMIRKTVNIYQIESRNPHLHEYKGDEHVDRMIEASLSTIYHSYLCPEPLKEDIQRELDQRNIRPPDEAIPRLRCYPPLAEANLKAFRQAIEEDSSLIEVERLLRAGE
jgi:mannosyl-3-phosphoglycerate synthase